MTREEAILELKTGYPKDDTPTEECVRYEEAVSMAIEALENEKNLKYEIKDLKNKVEYLEMKLKEQRPHGEWRYLKELITELRDADGKLNQKKTCQFILNLMGVIEREVE